MSVINQMLKDLQDRAPESEQPVTTPIMTAEPKSSVKLVAIIITIILLCNIVGMYMWFLLSENNSLKAEQRKSATIKIFPANVQTNIPEQVIGDDKEVALTKVNNINDKSISTSSDKQLSPKKIAHNTEVEKIAAVTKSMASSPTEETDNTTVLLKKELPSKSVIMAYKEEKQNTKMVEPDINGVKKTVNKAQMSVSSRHFTSAELVVQKLAQAEAAINSNNIAKAEQLFEDILIVDATQNQARKKLAALRFGRQAWQEATNLLSQGIAMQPKDSELRMMQAQIFIKQGKSVLAYQALIPLAQLEQQDYQVLLANTAQQVTQYEAASNAYKLLIKMQPNSARWYLGLAIVYDQNSQFNLATPQYKLALKQGGLSADSASFAQQRIQALGE